MTLDHAGWILAVGLLLNIFSFLLGKRFGRGDCQSCGITELKAETTALKAEIGRLCNLIETLWENAGLTVKERLEIQKMNIGV